MHKISVSKTGSQKIWFGVGLQKLGKINIIGFSKGSNSKSYCEFLYYTFYQPIAYCDRISYLEHIEFLSFQFASPKVTLLDRKTQSTSKLSTYLLLISQPFSVLSWESKKMRKHQNYSLLCYYYKCFSVNLYTSQLQWMNQ